MLGVNGDSGPSGVAITTLPFNPALNLPGLLVLVAHPTHSPPKKRLHSVRLAKGYGRVEGAAVARDSLYAPACAHDP